MFILKHFKNYAAKFVIGLICGASLVFSFQYWQSAADRTVLVAAQDCYETSPIQVTRIDCWMGMIEEVFAEEGTGAAFDLFQDIYLTYDDFANLECHKNAHRVGDLSFYHDYLTHNDLAKVDFPPNATACGYGFYHGFVEHLIQNQPTEEYVDEACTYLKENISDVAPAIGSTCYHGAGHGLLLAQADSLLNPEEWTVENFTSEPLRKCGRLKKASVDEIKQCYTGVFTVLSTWQLAGEYGLPYTPLEPFSHCDQITVEEYQIPCYEEASQILNIGDDLTVAKIFELAQTGERQDLVTVTLKVGIYGLVQRDPDGLTAETVNECRQTLSVLNNGTKLCVRAFAEGLAEHGPPGIEYKYINKFCTSDMIFEEERDYCAAVLAEKMQRFRSPKELDVLCKEGEVMPLACEIIAQSTG